MGDSAKHLEKTIMGDSAKHLEKTIMGDSAKHLISKAHLLFLNITCVYQANLQIKHFFRPQKHDLMKSGIKLLVLTMLELQSFLTKVLDYLTPIFFEQIDVIMVFTKS